MIEYKNTLEGYEPDNADTIPDEEDNGIGLSAGTKVANEEHGDGIVLAILRGRGMFYGGRTVADVAFGIDPDTEPEDLDLKINEDGEHEGFYVERMDPYALELI